MATNYNAILDYVLSETIKRKNDHPTVYFVGADRKVLRIIPNKEISDKFGIEEFEVDIMYFELTDNAYINSMTGNATLKGLEFSIAGGFTEKRKKETISTTLQLAQTWAIAVGTCGLLVWEVWKYLLENYCWCI